MSFTITTIFILAVTLITVIYARLGGCALPALGAALHLELPRWHSVAEMGALLEHRVLAEAKVDVLGLGHRLR